VEKSKSSGKSTYIIIILVFTLAALSALFAGYSWRELKDIRADINEGKKELPAWGKLAVKIQKIQEEKKASEKIFVSKTEKEYDKFLDSEVRSEGISLKRMDPGKPAKFNDELDQRTITLSANGVTVKKVVGFLYNEKKKKPNLKIKTIKLTPPKKKKKGLRDCDITITAYFKTG